MGLDMSLSKVNRNGSEKELIYWHKANQIHNWFRKKMKDPSKDNCTNLYLKKSDIIELQTDINKVLKTKGKKKRLEAAQKILPTTIGFFFGTTDYDEYYFIELKGTAARLETILEEYDENTKFVYSAWY